ncbi:M15 family metallopeptidase [Rhodococcus rhodochrous]|nr:M15 family metallopeptidase [Rhodococcus rhodochrous]MCQ4136679.1 M15 family metallopeptidase [Rhodococcus rhodochrous]
MCNRDECERIYIPGANNDFLAAMIVRSGPSEVVLRAWATWYHRNVEPLDRYQSGVGDDWGWSATNDVANSNHLSGTALDFNATQYPWGRRVMPADRIAKVREGLKLFRGFIFWGADWSRADEMHYQIGVPEFDADGVPNRALAAFAKDLETGYLGLLTTTGNAHAPAPTPSPAPAPAPVVGGGVEWSDVSQYQGIPVNDSYPHRILCIRSNSGDKRDTLFEKNAEWAGRALETGRLDALIVYYFFRPGQANCDLHKTMLEEVGLWKHPKVVSMIDVEDANGQIHGDQSWEANDEVARMRRWYGDDRRVIGYFNQRANGPLWPNRPANMLFVVPDYSAAKGAPRYPYAGAEIHQFTDKGKCAPWTSGVDLNYSKLSLPELCSRLGVPAPGGDAPMSAAEVADIKKFIADYMGPVISDLKDVRELLTGSRDNPNFPKGKEDYKGLPSLYDVRAGVPVEKAYHATIPDYIRELDAKTEALVRIVAAMASKLDEKGDE